MKITIEIYQDIKQVREAYISHYGKQDKKPNLDDLRRFLKALIESDLEAVMCSEPNA